MAGASLKSAINYPFLSSPLSITKKSSFLEYRWRSFGSAFSKFPLEAGCSALGSTHHQISSPHPRYIHATVRQRNRDLSTHAKSGASSSVAEQESSDPLLRGLLTTVASVYLSKNPTAARALELIREHTRAPLAYDHFAFRTFGVDGLGIESLAETFLALGYTRRDELKFPAKKLRAFWFSPPPTERQDGDGCDGPLPRVFISELLVDQLSAHAQETVRRYMDATPGLPGQAALSSATGALPWPTPDLEDYQALASESEYAAWTLVNAYALNHTTVSVHRLPSLNELAALNAFLQSHNLLLNSEGGTIKESPDKLLLQSSTVADSASFHFAGGKTACIPMSYIEFAQRLVLPEFAHVPSSQVEERHRREGFEVGNADKIFESTYSDQTGRRLAQKKA